MPRPRRPEYDSAEFYDLWHSDVTLEAMAERYDVSTVSIWQAAMRRGFQPKYFLRAG